MSTIQVSFPHDYVEKILKLSIEEQVRLIEIISANLIKMLKSRDHDAEEDDDLTQFCGKWQDERDADEIVSQIYADRKMNTRSERAVL